MRTVIFAALLGMAIGLIGCATTMQPDGTMAWTIDKGSTDTGKFISNLREITHNDAIAATKLAVDGKDADGAACYMAIDNFVACVNPNASAQGPQVTGGMVAHERLRLGATDLTSSNGCFAAARSACAAMVMSDLEFRARFMALIATFAPK